MRRQVICLRAAEVVNSYRKESTELPLRQRLGLVVESLHSEISCTPE